MKSSGPFDSYVDDLNIIGTQEEVDDAQTYMKKRVRNKRSRQDKVLS